jgi:hypothetical protein
METPNSETSDSPQQFKIRRRQARNNLLHITANWVGHVLDKHTPGIDQNILLEPGNAYLTDPLNTEEQNTLPNQPNWTCSVCATLERQAQNIEARLKEIEKAEIQSWVTFPLD